MGNFDQQRAIGAKGETAAVDLLNLDFPGLRATFPGGLIVFTPYAGRSLFNAILNSLEPDADFFHHQSFGTSPGWEGDAARLAERLNIGRRQHDYETAEGKRGECKYDRNVWKYGNFYIQTKPNGLYGLEGVNPLWSIAVGNQEDKPCCVLRMNTDRLKQLVETVGVFTPTRDGKREGYIVKVDKLLRYMAY